MLTKQTSRIFCLQTAAHRQ